MEYHYRLVFVKGGESPAAHEVKGYAAFTELCRDRTGMGWLLLSVEVMESHPFDDKMDHRGY